MIIEPDEIERRAYPRDAGDEMQPAREQVEPFYEVRFDALAPST
jgi:hypothetical protein